MYNYKLRWLVDESIRANSLRKDTATDAATIKSQGNVIKFQGVQLKADSGIFVAKDSVSSAYKQSFHKEVKEHGKTQDKLVRAKTINTVLGTTGVILSLLLVLVSTR